MTNQLLVRLCWEKRNSDELLLFVYHFARTHCGKIFGTFKATHWSPEVSYFNKHFPGWKLVLCYELIISSDRNL